MAEPNPAMLTRRVLVGGAFETTPGTAATITAATINAKPAFITDIKLDGPLDLFAGNERTPDGTHGGQMVAIPGKQHGKLSFNIELAHDCGFFQLLPIAGYKLTSTTYAPYSSMDYPTSLKTMTFAVWEDGRRKGLVGAQMDSFSIPFKRGARVIAAVTCIGVWVAPTTEAMPAEPTFPTAPYVGHGATLSLSDVGGSSEDVPYFDTMTLTGNPQVEERGNAMSATSILHYHTVDRKPEIKLDCEARTPALRDVFSLMLLGTPASMSYVCRDGFGATYHTLTIAAPALQRRSVTHGERNKVLVDEETFACTSTMITGDDELTIAEATVGS